MKDSVQNPYNKELSKTYSSDYRFDHPHQFMAYSTWLEELGDIKGKRVLDLACGGGISTRMLSDKGAIVTGVDISEDMLSVAVKKEAESPAGNKYIVADAAIPKKYSNEPFDLVTATFLLHYARNAEALDGFVNNISLNLKSGGRFISINLSPEHPIVAPGENISHSSRWLDEPFKDGSRLEVILWSLDNKPILNLTDYHWTKQTYENSLRKAGFKSIKWVKVKMHKEGKALKNWKELEVNNMLVVIVAEKA